MTTKTKPAPSNGTEPPAVDSPPAGDSPPAPPHQQLAEYLEANGWVVVPCAIGPTGEAISLEAAMMPDLLRAGWQPGYKVVVKRGNG